MTALRLGHPHGEVVMYRIPRRWTDLVTPTRYTVTRWYQRDERACFDAKLEDGSEVTEFEDEVTYSKEAALVVLGDLCLERLKRLREAQEQVTAVLHEIDAHMREVAGD